MKKRYTWLFIPVLVLTLFASCGADDELAAEPNEENPAETVKPDSAATTHQEEIPTLLQLLDRVPEIKTVFHTKDFDQNGTYAELDTAFVRHNQLVPASYVFEMPESWQAVGKMYYNERILLIVNYSNPSANNLELFVYDQQATMLTSLPLALNMLVEGQVPAEASINPQGLVTIVYKDQRTSIRKDFELTGDEFKLVKTVELPK